VTTQVVEPKSTNEIIEEETEKIDVLARYLQDSIDENVRLASPKGCSKISKSFKLRARQL
jgi:hypothetical protein